MEIEEEEGALIGTCAECHAGGQISVPTGEEGKKEDAWERVTTMRPIWSHIWGAKRLGGFICSLHFAFYALLEPIIAEIPHGRRANIPISLSLFVSVCSNNVMSVFRVQLTGSRSSHSLPIYARDVNGIARRIHTCQL